MADRYTVGLIADTHDIDTPARPVQILAQMPCDYNVHLGDIGGSQIVMRVVREFKRHLGDVEHLPAEERKLFSDALADGSSRLGAYIEARVGRRMLSERRAETAFAYETVLGSMAKLSNPLIIKGNVDGLQLQSPQVQDAFAKSALPLISRPRFIDLAWLALILWPSWRPASPEESAEAEATVVDFATRCTGKEHVLVLAHEHCFKGPVTAVYTARVGAAGLQQRSAPRFGPSPTSQCLLRLFRTLDDSASVHYVFGHIHDSATVLRAGLPALRDPAGPGLRYRLYGLGHRGGTRGANKRRSIEMLPVGVNEVCLLALARGRTEVSWQVVEAA